MYIQSARLKRIKAERRRRAVVKLTIAAILIMVIFQWVGPRYKVVIQTPIYLEKVEQKMISPLPDEATPSATPKTATPGASIQIVRPALAKEPEVKKVQESIAPTKSETLNSIEGEASYYSRAGCLGCDEKMIMANGQELDDTALTLALTPEVVSQGKRLNDLVTVQNLKNGLTVRAKVTDTGGFGRLGRVADLSVATKDAIKCASLCQVKIVFE